MHKKHPLYQKKLQRAIGSGFSLAGWSSCHHHDWGLLRLRRWALVHLARNVHWFSLTFQGYLYQGCTSNQAPLFKTSWWCTSAWEALSDLVSASCTSLPWTSCHITLTTGTSSRLYQGQPSIQLIFCCRLGLATGIAAAGSGVGQVH